MPTLTFGQGLAIDEESQELGDGFCSNGLNVRFVDGYAQRFAGHSAVLNTPSAAAYHVASYITSTKNYWIHSTLTATYADDGTTKTDITGTALSGAAGDRFTSCVVGGVYVQNNQVQVPMSWGGDTGTDLAALTAWDSTWRCKAIRSFKVYLIALNVTKGSNAYPSMMKWSSEADPGSLPTSWDEADATNNAGENDLSETSDKVVDGMALGDVFVVYKERSAYGMQLTGGTEVFRFFRLPGEYGMLSQNCAAQFPGGHAVFGTSDIVVHNGGEPTSILKARMRRWLYARIDSTYFARSFVVPNHAKSEVWFCYPVAGSVGACTEALVWNYVDNAFGVRTLPDATAATFGPIDISSTNTWNGNADAWNDATTAWDELDISKADKRVIMSSTDAKMYLMDQGGKFDTSAFRARIERTGLTFGDQSQVKWLRSVTPRIAGSNGTMVYIQVGGSFTPEQGVMWGTPVLHTVGSTQTGKVDATATGKFLAFRVYSDSGSWRLKSVDFDVPKMGKY